MDQRLAEAVAEINAKSEGRLSTHWENCWEAHHTCCILALSDARAALAASELRASKGDAAIAACEVLAEAYAPDASFIDLHERIQAKIAASEAQCAAMRLLLVECWAVCGDPTQRELHARVLAAIEARP